MSDKTKFCTNCGADIDIRAELCPKCGVRQTLIPSQNVQQVEPKKGRPVWQWIVIAFIVLGVIGNLGGSSGDAGPSSSSASTPTAEYEWVTIQLNEFDTEGEFADAIMTEIYPQIKLPTDATKWSVGVKWSGGDKDSYVSITCWEYGTVDDTNKGQIYENAKLGEKFSKDFKCEGGETVYAEGSILNNCEGQIAILAYVPK